MEPAHRCRALHRWIDRRVRAGSAPETPAHGLHANLADQTRLVVAANESQISRPFVSRTPVLCGITAPAPSLGSNDP